MTHKKKIKKHYSTVGLYIRSFIVWLCMTLLIPVCGISVMLAFFIPMRYRHAMIRIYLALYMIMLRKVCHLDYHVEGLEHIPKKHTAIVMSKHQSTWETFFLPLLFHNPAIILKRELLWVPFFGWGLAASGPIVIDRSKKRSAMQQLISKGKVFLDQGRWILIFPEGTRTPYGTVGQYKIGGARLASATGYGILPVAHDAGRYWPKRGFLKYPGTIRVVIGPLIESKGRTAEEMLRLTKDWIEGTMQRIAD